MTAISTDSKKTSDRESSIQNALTPVNIKGTSIYLDSKEFLAHLSHNPMDRSFTLFDIIPLSSKTSSLFLYDDGVLAREYVLQAEDSDDFSGKFFHICVRLVLHGVPSAPVAQIDGFIFD